ncbi:sarcosine oxidase subunit gamma [Pseudonocardia endophytica]|uniref:Sarcosine oxidase subunit gamma n=1 Tax=Pseudonocardia endophytica TaxID=401976 RepID=A0A4R1HPX2_PSEEN|nr:sarcosine oxidase subunit gamma [Pseudonocardia endophytica]
MSRSAVAVVNGRVRDGWEIGAGVSTARLTLRDESPLSKIVVRAPFTGAVRTDLGVSFGRTTRADVAGVGQVLVVGAAPGEWVVLGPIGSGIRLLGDLHERLAASGEFASAVDITHGRCLVRLHGPDARRTLAKVCGIDLADDSVPDGSALRTSVARIVTDMVRDDVDGELSYLLHCERSSGQFLADMLLDAGSEFGIEVTGFASGAATLAGGAR